MNKYSICTECGSKMPYRTDLEYTYNGITIKSVKGYKCEKCGEIEFELEEARRIEKLIAESED